MDRDRTSIRLLDGLVHATRGRAVVIGGYAVSARAMPRFSVDLDLVVPSGVAPACRTHLLEQGLERNKRWRGGAVFKGESEQWVLGRGLLQPTVDLLIGGLHDRQSGVSLSYREISGRSEPATVRGFSVGASVQALVPTREALIGLKLLPFRGTDIRDIFALCFPPIDAAGVVRFLRGWSKEEIRNRAREFGARIVGSGFRGSVKQTFLLPDDRAFDRQILAARRFAATLEQAAR